jgi:hypothetical protein
MPGIELGLLIQILLPLGFSLGLLLLDLLIPLLYL